MAKKAIIAAAAIIAVTALAADYLTDTVSCPDFNEREVVINDNRTITVNLAVTPARQSRGLAGCSSLQLGQGMYFDIGQKKDAVFWMKDMLTPIDIIWISGKQVIAVEQNVPTEDNNNLTKYYSPGAVDAVLEVGAGHAAQLGITPGATIKISNH